ncbi:hypothetical protein [Mycolicibacterium phlei]
MSAHDTPRFYGSLRTLAAAGSLGAPRETTEVDGFPPIFVNNRSFGGLASSIPVKPKTRT